MTLTESYARLLQPASAKCFVKMNHRLNSCERDLRQLVLRGKKSLLRLKHSEQFGGALAILKLSYLEGFPCGLDFSLKVLFPAQI